MVTRPQEQSGELASLLAPFGQVVALPAIAIHPPLDPTPLRTAAEQIHSYDWIVFTSANAVEALLGHLPEIPNTHIACVGDKTAEAAEKAGFTNIFHARTYSAESLLAEMPDVGDARILLPQSEIAQPTMRTGLQARGALVDAVTAYRVAIPDDTRQRAPEIFAHPPDWVVFASPSAVDALCSLVGAQKLAQSRLASIGPSTSQALRAHGLEPAVEAVPHTAVGLACAIMQER